MSRSELKRYTRTQANAEALPDRAEKRRERCERSTDGRRKEPKGALLEFEIRLVANVLEADWNARLRELTQGRVGDRRHNEAEQRKCSALEQQMIADLVDDFPRVWRDPRTSNRDRKRMVRLLLEDVTVLTDEVITAHVRFQGGATETITS